MIYLKELISIYKRNNVRLVFGLVSNPPYTDHSFSCECVKQYEYWSQEGGLLKLDEDLINRCTDFYKDANANSYPEDLNSAERNAQQKCN